MSQEAIEQEARAIAEAFGKLEIVPEDEALEITEKTDRTLETLVFDDEDDDEPQTELIPLAFDQDDEGFTEEDLLLALNSIQQDPLSDSNSEEEDDNDLLTRHLPGLPEISNVDLELPVLEIGSGNEDDDDILVPLEDIEQVFEVVDPIEDDDDDDDIDATEDGALEILKQLEALDLDLERPLAPESFLGADDDVPPWFYCQPCNPQYNNRGEPPAERNFYQEQLLDSLLDLRELRLEDDDALAMAQDDIQQMPLTSTAEKAFSVTPEIKVSAAPLLATFGVEKIDETKTNEARESPRGQRECFGNEERILGVHMSPCGKFFGTAGQDSTVRIFRISDNKQLSVLKHDKDYECLRIAWASSTWGSETVDRALCPYLLATGSANGEVRVYQSQDPALDDWQVAVSLDHAEMPHFHPEDPKDKPQVYALQFIDDYRAGSGDERANAVLLTSSDDHIHLWDLDESKRVKKESSESSKKDQKVWRLNEIFSVSFADMHDYGYGVHVGQVTADGMVRAAQLTGEEATKSYGGPRNPRGLIYVFDACYCAANSLLGVALSDGSLRLVNGRGVCVSVIQLPGQQSHLTSFSWDSDGKRLATCVATGHLVVWGIHFDQHGNYTRTNCNAVFEGGHVPGRPLFGAKYFGTNDDLVISWGVDGRICLWDANARNEHDRPLALLLDKPDYPIYAVDMDKDSILVSGGTGGLIGVPSFIFDIKTTDHKGIK